MTVGRALLALLVLLPWTPCAAHDSRPVYVQITEPQPGHYDVLWQVPVTVEVQASPTPVLPGTCRSLAPPRTHAAPGGRVTRQRYRCPDGLAGQPLTVAYPTVNPSLSTLVRVTLTGGERHVRVLKPGESTWQIPSEVEPLAVARQYTVLGVTHIWRGVDHLLFVACLVLLARTPRRILLTITGFTLAHSATLALSTLDVIRLPVPPVEAVIALSVVFLARELALDDGLNDGHSLSSRHPVAVSCAFGLLHGLGFAAVLREVGLPASDRIAALLFFNVGVEIGQVLFVLLLLPLLALSARWLARRRDAQIAAGGHVLLLQRPVAYVVGAVASLWMFQRIAGFWG
jgi:hydrogenase/urease accessory protein HupE